MFQPGNKLAPGGARPNSGPKPTQLKAELASIWDKHAPLEKREAIIKAQIKAAEAGDLKAALFVIRHIYGSGDDRLAEARADLARRQASLVPFQKKLLEAQANNMNTVTELQKQGYVGEQMFVEGVRNLSSRAISAFRNLPREEILRLAENEILWNAFLERTGNQIINEAEDIIEGAEVLALPPPEEPEDVEG